MMLDGLTITEGYLMLDGLLITEGILMGAICSKHTLATYLAAVTKVLCLIILPTGAQEMLQLNFPLQFGKCLFLSRCGSPHGRVSAAAM